MEIELWFNYIYVCVVCGILVVLVNVCLFECLVCGYVCFVGLIWLMFVELFWIVV